MRTAIAYGLVGMLLAGALLLLPDGQEWRPEDEALLREAIRLGERVARQTFPGWKPAEIPFLVLKGPANYLVDRSGVERLERPAIPFLVAGPYELEGRPVALVPAKTALDRSLRGIRETGSLAGGEQSILEGLLGVGGGERLTAEQYVTVALHESFHAYQLPVLKAWADRIDAPERELWQRIYRDEANNRWQNVEGALLYQAAMAPDQASAREWAARFLAVRAERRAYWKEDPVLEWERFYEWAEGLARYIEIRAWEAGAGPGYAGGAQRLIAEVREPVDPDAPRDRVYRLGAAQALVLDRLRPGWQAEAARGVDLEALLREAIS